LSDMDPRFAQQIARLTLGRPRLRLVCLPSEESPTVVYLTEEDEDHDSGPGDLGCKTIVERIAKLGRACGFLRFPVQKENINEEEIGS